MKYEVTRFYSKLTDEQLLDKLRRVAAGLGGDQLTALQYVEIGKGSIATITRRFGSWNRALTLAGLKVSRDFNVPVAKLFENLNRVWVSLGHQPRIDDMRPPLSKYGYVTYRRVFGTWRHAIETFAGYCKQLQKAGRPLAFKGEKIDVVVPKHTTPRNINLRMRHMILKRDFYKCRACGASPATDPSVVLHVDHIIAWHNGGESVPENLQVLCSLCNIGKSDLL